MPKSTLVATAQLPDARRLYRLGWRLGPVLPRTVQQLLAQAGARVAAGRSGWHLERLRENLQMATGKPVPNDLVRRSVASYLRNMIEMFALPGWSDAEIVSRVTTTGEEHLRRAYGDTGAVVALPHSGNWDLAGAWACRTGMPVTTVVEQLDEPEFSAFRSFRESLGMQIMSHRDSTALTDQDLLGTGLPVRWRDRPVTLPAGPAVVARRTGAALLPTVGTFTSAGIHLDIGHPVAPRPGRDGLIWMTQQLADFFADRIAAYPQDWHLMQPFFPAAEGERR